MNLLFVLPHYNLDKIKSGSTSRTYNLLKYISKNHNVTILQCNGKHERIKGVKAKVINFRPFWLFGRHPSYLLKYSGDFRRKLEKALDSEKIDKVIHEFPWNFPYVYKEAHERGIPVVYEAHNVECENVDSSWGARLGVLRVFLSMIKRIITHHEVSACWHSEKIIAVSKNDADLFKKIFYVDKSKIAVVPNGVDLSLYSGSVQKNRIKDMFNLPHNKRLIMFHGTAKYLANDDAVMTLRKFADTLDDKWYVVIAGSGMPVFEDKRIKSVGFVENLPLLLKSVDFALVPLRYASGTRLKVLEYFAAGIPVIATAKSIEGLNVDNGREFVLINDISSEEMKAKLSIAKRKDKSLVKKAKRFVNDYDWKKIAGIYEKEVLK